VLHEFLDGFCSAYLDVIIIYSESPEEDRDHVEKVLKALSAGGLSLKLEKCEFHWMEVKYLGLIISTEGIKRDPERIEAICDWPVPTNCHGSILLPTASECLYY
jgi:hypothetical protein